MKKLTFFTLLIFICIKGWGQNKIESIGSVGIGTTSPLSDLHIRNAQPLTNHKTLLTIESKAPDIFNNNVGPALFFSTNIGLAKIVAIDLRGSNSDTFKGGLVFKTRRHVDGDDSGFYERMRITDNGNVGIGTDSPQSKLHINSGRKGLNVSGSMGGDNFTDHQAVFLFSDSGISESGIKINKKNGGDNFELFNAFYNNHELFVIHSSGNVGIGTTTPQAKLDVAGTIRATEIKVEAQTADFVFQPDYKLRSLNEVEQFVKENKHLPEIPSAKEMEVNGVNLAEMNKLLLQKIEELTLYSIKLNQENNDLRVNQIKDVNERKALEERLTRIEALLLNQ